MEQIEGWLPSVQELLAIGQLIMLILTIAVFWKKAKPEINKIDADADASSASAVESFAKATQIYSEELNKVNEKVSTLIRNIEEKDAQIRERDQIILEQKNTIDYVTDWAERLVYQVRSLGQVPVPYKVEVKAEASAALQEVKPIKNEKSKSKESN